MSRDQMVVTAPGRYASFVPALCSEPDSPYELDEWVPDRERVAAPPHLHGVCVRCVLRPECLVWAVESGSRGYWAGTSRRERVKLVEAGEVSVAAADALRVGVVEPSEEPLHEQGAGGLRWYRRGCRCDECRAANSRKSRRDRMRRHRTK